MSENEDNEDLNPSHDHAARRLVKSLPQVDPSNSHPRLFTVGATYQLYDVQVGRETPLLLHLLTNLTGQETVPEERIDEVSPLSVDLPALHQGLEVQVLKHGCPKLGKILVVDNEAGERHLVVFVSAKYNVHVCM